MGQRSGSGFQGTRYAGTRYGVQDKQIGPERQAQGGRPKEGGKPKAGYAGTREGSPGGSLGRQAQGGRPREGGKPKAEGRPRGRVAA